MKLDFEKWAEHYPAAGNYPYFSRLRDRSSRGNVANRVPLSREDIAQKIVRMAGRLLRHSEDVISFDTPLREYGMDSLRALELRNHIESEFNVRIPAVAMWRFPAAATLASHIHEYFNNDVRQNENEDFAAALDAVRNRISVLEETLR
jgi:acyl carrier protein